jgi:hypothetical protein
VTVSGETGTVWTEVRTRATDSPYRWTSVSLDKNFGSTWVSAGLSRLEEKQTLLGGRMGNALGGGGSNSLFLDVEARRELGGGFSAGLMARRGWTDFAAARCRPTPMRSTSSSPACSAAGDRLGLRIRSRCVSKRRLRDDAANSL